ncbi:hypothetical protein HPB48_021721 [Haemaphysalis longicornis]|uniref:Uncharacterized protein n=1 Tax=Haemaphysalis longicornis TaxID=44386 RepID=A0A9J6GXV0_HAELO|nr:hypothetical protein HPB48_021721 [Haemaphysalis longicornis]
MTTGDGDENLRAGGGSTSRATGTRMSSVRRLEAFDATTSQWPEHHERVLLYFAANDVPEDKRKAVFLTSCGAATYSLPRNLLSPNKPGDATLVVIYAALGAKPKVSEVVATVKFLLRTRLEGEGVSDYVAAPNILVDH